jgi:hypothetical protein
MSGAAAAGNGSGENTSRKSNSLQQKAITIFKEEEESKKKGEDTPFLAFKTSEVSSKSIIERKYSKDELWKDLERIYKSPKDTRNYATDDSCGVQTSKIRGKSQHRYNTLGLTEDFNSLDNMRCEFMFSEEDGSEFSAKNPEISNRNITRFLRSYQCLMRRLQSHLYWYGTGETRKGVQWGNAGNPKTYDDIQGYTKGNTYVTKEQAQIDTREHIRQILWAMLATKRCINCIYKSKKSPSFFELNEFLKEVNNFLPTDFQLNVDYKPTSTDLGLSPEQKQRLFTFKRGCPVRTLKFSRTRKAELNAEKAEAKAKKRADELKAKQAAANNARNKHNKRIATEMETFLYFRNNIFKIIIQPLFNIDKNYKKSIVDLFNQEIKDKKTIGSDVQSKIDTLYGEKEHTFDNLDILIKQHILTKFLEKINDKIAALDDILAQQTNTNTSASRASASRASASRGSASRGSASRMSGSRIKLTAKEITEKRELLEAIHSNKVETERLLEPINVEVQNEQIKGEILNNHSKVLEELIKLESANNNNGKVEISVEIINLIEKLNADIEKIRSLNRTYQFNSEHELYNTGYLRQVKNMTKGLGSKITAKRKEKLQMSGTKVGNKTRKNSSS